MGGFKDKIIDKLLTYVPDGKVRTEAAIRSEKKGTKIPSKEIKRSSALFSPKSIKDWNNAVALATDCENPDFSFLADLYKSLRLDSHVVSVIENRVYRVLRSKYVFVNDNGDEVPEAKALFERPWFEEFTKQTLWSLFTGVKVIEIFDIDETLELQKTTAIPMAHINPNKGLILKEPGDEKGWDYRNGVLADYYLQIGENTDLGILADVAPLILAKKQAMGAWLDYIEKFGIPPRFVTTDNMTEDRSTELLQMMLAMINNHVAVLKGGEKIEIGDVPNTDAHKVFDEMIKRLNSEISKRILGQDGTSDNKDASGTYGSIKVLQDVANDRHESDKLFLQFIVNKHLIPRLLKLSSFYTPLTNLQFDWDDTEQMDKGDLIDKAVALSNAGFVIDAQILADKTGMPITGFQNPTNNNLPEETPKKKKLNPTPKQ